MKAATVLAQVAIVDKREAPLHAGPVKERAYEAIVRLLS